MKVCITAKLPTAMRLSVHLLWLVTLSSISMANNGYAQVLERRLTITVHKTPIQEVLTEIEKLTNVKFFYSVDQLANEAPVTITARNEKLGRVLDRLFTPRNLQYTVHEHEATITLRKLIQPDESSSRKSLRQSNNYSAIEITGRVTDNNSQPLAGVNILVKGTTKGTTTGADGRYNIEVGQQETLVFSFIGYATREVLVGDQVVINVVLNEDIRSLNEVTINAGYYSATRENQTGSIVKIPDTDIAKNPVANPLAALQGRVPGLQITQETGIPGGYLKVRIRGTNSIANGNDPLYIIDGVPFISTPLTFTEASAELIVNGASPMHLIDPANIQSIEILKDADATAIYGSRGANGVILITTKKGQAGDLSVNFDAYTGIGRVARRVDMLNTQQYLEMRHEAFANDGLDPTSANAPDLLLWDTTRYTDWQEVLLGGSARITDSQLRLSGGNALTNFSIGAGYHKETTVFPGSDFDGRGSIRFNLSSTSKNEKLKIALSASFSANETNIQDRDLTSIALRLPPNAPALFDQTGALNWENSTWTNPLSNLRRRYHSTTNFSSGTATLTYQLRPTLNIETRLGYTRAEMESTTTMPKSSQNPAYAASAQNYTTFSERSFRTWIIEPQANYKAKIGPGQLDMLVGAALHDQRLEGQAQFAYGFVSEALMATIAAASNVIPLRALYSQYRYTAIFGRINYNVSNKYVINLTARRDGSSRFGPHKQFANFGAIGLAWIFSNEPFIKSNFPFLSFGKVRGSFGITGNDQLADYNYLDTYSTTGTYQDVVGLTPTRLSNPDFAWETNKKFEATMELGFIDDRISLAFSYYNNSSSNQLIGYPLPPTTGFASIQGNFPATLQNTGFELHAITVIVDNEHFSWTTALNLSIPRNKLVDFPNLESSSQYANRLVVGKPLTIRKLYASTGVDPETGTYQYIDTNQDGTLSIADRQVIKDVSQEFYGGVENSFRFKNFQVDLLFQGARQTGYNPLLTNWAYPGSNANQPLEVLDRWQQEGDLTTIQKFTSTFSSTATAYFNLASSDKSVFDTSFIRLKNISLTYTLPSRFSNKLHVQLAKIFVRGQNILTITNFTGLDPEVQSINLPPLTTFIGGIHITI